MDFEDSLTLEEQFYQEGYQEGVNENMHKNLIEGKEYGLQVGFQRFLLLGQIKGMCEAMDLPELSSHTAAINKLIDEINLDNEEDSVAVFEKNMIKIKNKLRVLLSLYNKQAKSQNLESLSLEALSRVNKAAGGEISNSYLDVNDESW